MNVKWIKFSTDTFNDEKIRLIESLPECDTILIIWFKILALAGRTNAGGYLLFNSTIPYTDEMLATLFNRNIHTVRLAIQTFVNFGMIEIDEQQTMLISNWEKHQNVDGLERIKEQNRLRQQKHRQKKMHLNAPQNAPNAPENAPQNEVQTGAKRETIDLKEGAKGRTLDLEEVQTFENAPPGKKSKMPLNQRLCDEEVQNITLPVTLYNALDIDKEKENNMCISPNAPGAQSAHVTASKKSKNDYTKEFLDFWELYPNKKDKKAAFTKFKSTIKTHSFESIINGTKAYALECEQQNREQKYIKMAKTFLHNETFTEYEEVGVTAKKAPQAGFTPIQQIKLEEEEDEWTNTNDNTFTKNNGSGLL